MRRYVATPDGHKVFWPDGMEPADFVPYRGLEVAGERREWRDVPYPEKMWLVRKVVSAGSTDAARAIAEEIGVGRITANFRSEIAALVHHLERGASRR